MMNNTSSRKAVTLNWLEKFKAAQHGLIEIVDEKVCFVGRYSTYNHFITVVPHEKNALGFKLRYEEAYGIFILELLLSEIIPGVELIFGADYLQDEEQEEVLNEIAAGHVVINEYVFNRKSYYQCVFPKSEIKFSNTGFLKELKMRRAVPTKTYTFSPYTCLMTTFVVGELGEV